LGHKTDTFYLCFETFRYYFILWVNMGSIKHDHEPGKAAAAITAISGGEVRDATEAEHNMTLWASLKMYPTAVGWSMFFSLGTIMTAFDPQLLGNLYATPAFQRDFGYLFEGSYIISAPWQTALGMGNPMGQGMSLVS
jgi:SP family general alpha glucoside:H+ symporter-like MFS transporter